MKETRLQMTELCSFGFKERKELTVEITEVNKGVEAVASQRESPVPNKRVLGGGNCVSGREDIVPNKLKFDMKKLNFLSLRVTRYFK